MAEWSIASDLKSDECKKFREFESHSFLYSSVTSITTPFSLSLPLFELFVEV
jgi:hypothetical protein